MLDTPEISVLLIGDCRFDPRSQELWREGACVRLPKRLSQLLLYLARISPAVVTRQALIDEVWQRRMVEDDVLSRAIAELRRALGDDTKTPRYIETIPKVGYRLNAAVECEPPNVATPLIEPVLANAPLPTDSELRGLARAPKRQRLRPIDIVLILAALSALIAFGIYLTSDRVHMALAASDAARIRPLTSAPGFESRPDVSPDGQWVVYTESSVDGNPSQLVLQDIDSNHREILESSPQLNLRPEFNADGRRLAFLHIEKDRCELRLRSIPGAEGKTLTECARALASTPAWSTQRSQIVFTAPAAEGHSPGLSLVDAVTGVVRSLTRPSITEGPDADPEWVPGTAAITFARGHDGEQHLMRLDIDAVHAKPIELIDAGRLQGHAWSPDGKQLLVATDQPGYRTLVLFDPNGKQMEVLGARGGRYPSWADNGELVFESAQYDANIWRLALDMSGAAPERVIASTRYDSSPTLNADDTQLAFVSTRNDFEQIFISAVDGTNQQRLPLPDGHRWSRPSFSPDGASLLVTGYDEHNRHWIYRHVIASGRTEPLRNLGEESSHGRFNAHGSEIFYMRRAANGVRSLWRIRTDRGAIPEVIAGSEGVEEFALTEDSVVISRIDRPGFGLLSLHQLVPTRQILADVQAITKAAWTLRKRNLYAVVREQNVSVLKRWNIDTGEAQWLASGIDADAVGQSLAVSNKEDSAWFARTDSISIDLMRLPAKAD